MDKKRGQIELSFSMIFSILIIIAIIAVGFYTIRFFLNLNKCSEIGYFYEKLDSEIDKAWKSPIYKGSFEAQVPGAIEKVCFGELNNSFNKQNEVEYNSLRQYRVLEKNVFMHPIKEACEGLEYYKLEHVNIEEFFCVELIDNEVKITLEKGTSDALVKLTK